MILKLGKGIEAFLFYVGLACGKFVSQFHRQPDAIVASSKTLKDWGVGEATNIGAMTVVQDDSMNEDEIQVL